MKPNEKKRKKQKTKKQRIESMDMHDGQNGIRCALLSSNSEIICTYTYIKRASKCEDSFKQYVDSEWVSVFYEEFLSNID